MSARHVGRRGLFAGSAMLLLVAGEAGSAKAEELDGELLAACRQYHDLRAQELPLDVQLKAATREQHDPLWAMLEDLWDEQDDLIATVTETRPKTPEGLRAKAQLADSLMRRRLKTEIATDCVTDEHRLNLSLIEDVLGRAPA